MNFTRLRLSSSPAVSPNIINAPSSPTKSVYLDMDETTPTSPQMPSYPYTLNNDTSERTPTTTTATSKPAGTATNAPTAGPSTRRTNFFDSDSSSDDDEDNDELITADDLAFSQRHSLVSPLPPLLPGDGGGGEDDNRGRPLTRSPPLLLPSPSIFSSSKQHPANDHHRKGAYYLGVRPEEYAFVCGTRPTSSVGDEGASSYYVEQGRGFDGYTRYDVPTASSSSPPLTASKKQRQTLRPEGVSPKHVPFGAPDLAVAARRVLAERGQRRGRKTRENMGMGGVAELMLKGRASSSVLGPSASEYEDLGWGRGGGENAAELSKGRPLSYGEGEADVGMSSPGNHGGKENAAAASKSDALEEGLHDGGPAETQSVLSKTDDNILGVHAITLQALLRDEEGLQASASSVRRKSASSEFSRKDIQKLHGQLSQQPRDSATSLPPPVPEIPPIVQIQQPKRVAMVPPPIDTSRSRGSRSDSKVKTPYPFHHHKNLPKTLGSPGIPGTRAKDAVLTLSIHRRSGVLSSRVARVTLPSELLEGNYHAANSSGDDIAPDEKPPPVFDDAAFFKELRTEYARLAGRWWRFFSARTLSRMTVGHTTAWSATESCPGPAACGGGRCCPAARAAHGGGLQQQQRGCSAATPSGIYHVRSPRFLASQGLKDTFSEENLLAHFRSPRMGRSRFAWVLWASRLAGLHEQPELSTWRARQRQQQQKGANWRERELPPTPGAGAAGKWVDTSGRTPSTASTAFAGGGSDNGSKDDVVEDTAMAELGLAGGIGPGHSIATLEFVEGWSITRILAAVLLVLLLAAAGIVLWILFGSGILVDGFRGSGARVGTAVLIGAGVLLFGWTLVLAWMGVSWCVV